MTHTFEHHRDRAVSAIEAGSFPTKSAQKNCLDSLNRAFDILCRDKNYDAIEAAGFKYYDVPFNLHQFRPKHFDLFVIAFGRETAQKVAALDVLRTAAKELEIVKPAKKPARVPTGNQATHQGTCQICGKMHKVNNKTGLLATHGYTLEYGFFNGECDGRHQKPFEVSSDALVKHIASVEAFVAGIDFNGFTVVTTRYGKEIKVPNTEIVEKQMRYIDWQKSRLANWKPRELTKVGA